MRVLDAAIHGRDLAQAIGVDEAPCDDVVAFLLAYTADLDFGPQQRAFALATPRFRATRHPKISCFTGWAAHPNVTEEV